MKAILFFFTLLFAGTPLLANDSLITATNQIYEYSIASKSLDETRAIRVYLPDSYHKGSQNYSVLYLLDGERHLDHAVLASKLLSEQQKIPEMIVVAIINKKDEREQNLALAKSKFFNFIKNELKPWTQKKFNTHNDSVIFGHSLAAYFAVSVLANHPDTFDRYIAAGPPLMVNQREIFSALEEVSTLEKFKEKRLFLSSASLSEEGEEVFNEIVKFHNLLKKRTPKAFKWAYQTFENETHITNYYISLYKGLSSIYQK